MTNSTSNLPIPTSQTAWIIGAIVSLLSLLGGGFLGFYNSICKDQLAFSQAQQQSLAVEIKTLTAAIQENNHLIKQSMRPQRSNRNDSN